MIFRIFVILVMASPGVYIVSILATEGPSAFRAKKASVECHAALRQRLKIGGAG